MANMTLVAASSPRFRCLGSAILRTPVNPRLSVGAASRMVQVNAQQEAWSSADNLKDAVDNVTETTVSEMGSNAASKVVETAKEVGEKAKQTAQDAWDSTKETAEKNKDAVVETAGDVKANVKDKAETVKQSMNSKDAGSP
ncbi:uncharacterized protein At4g13230-like [Aristolochia californica]|uniref:uncharacterized protein At4g13230-like n=1 Tax=Aristolochia californica TaxID=171875 RepID=UPI0035DD06AB